MAAENVLRHTEFFFFPNIDGWQPSCVLKECTMFPPYVLLCVVVLISGLGLNFPAESYATRSMFAWGTRISKL